MSEVDDIFVYNNGLRFLNKDVNTKERDNFKGWWVEQIYQYGTVIDYHTNSYSLSAHDALYGEQPGKEFTAPKQLIFAITLNENAVVLQKFGLVADDELTGFIPIESYTKALSTTENPNPEPKSGDIIELSEFGESRPGSRTGKMFEITERLEQDVEQINPLLGHYVWLIKGKRYDYSYELGMQPEGASDQVYDTSYAGGLSATTDDKLDNNKLYFDDVDRESRNIFDYSVYGDYDDIYGGYDDD